MDLSVRISGRDDDLSPFFRTSIAGIEKHLENVVKRKVNLDLNLVDLRLHGLTLSTLPDSFVLKHLSGILRLAITALITSPEDVDPLCNVLVEPLTARLPFSLLAPLLPANNIDLVLTLDSHVGIAKLLLDAFTRAANAGGYELVIAWKTFVFQYRTNIFELWLKHTDLGLADAAHKCLIAFFVSGAKAQHPEINSFFDEFIGRKIGVYEQIARQVEGQPSSLPSGTSSIHTSNSPDYLVALSRVLTILPSLMPVNPVVFCKSKLVRLAFAADVDVSSEFYISMLRLQTLVEMMYILYVLVDTQDSLPDDAIKTFLSVINMTFIVGGVDGMESIRSEMSCRVRPDLDNTKELKFQAWAKKEHLLDL